MRNNLYAAALILSIIVMIFWAFVSGVLERFSTIDANCQVNGLGVITIQHQYTNTNQSTNLVVGDRDVSVSSAAKTGDILKLKGTMLDLKLNLDKHTTFVILKNKSYSGKCTVQIFSM